MAHIDALVEKIADPELRKSMRKQIDALLERRSFGLVFQQHKPEVVELPNYAVRRGCSVKLVEDESSTTWHVREINDGIATLAAGDREIQEPLSGLVVVREFGDPIYPGLNSVGHVQRAPEKPVHTVINAENFHALETILYAYEDKVDAIYIDPPYNTGAKDWKYNNDYVDRVDDYRHSKWLAFMERRLRLAKRLLNHKESILVVTIDENEVHHLALLLEDIFPEAARQMVTIAINGKGVSKVGQMSRVEEYAFFIYVGNAQASPVADNLFNEALNDDVAVVEDPWASLLRRGTDAKRQDRESMFYPFFIDSVSKMVVSVGGSLPIGESRDSVPAPDGLRAVWPIRTDSSEGRWQIGRDSATELLQEGYLKLGAYNRKRDQWAIKYVPRGQRERVASGALMVTSVAADGSAILVEKTQKLAAAKTIWNRTRHNAGSYGSGLLRALIPGRSFPFPKSLYAVADTLRVMVGAKPDALVLDFFGGSGTTTHAVAYLNAEDGGNRRSIVVTNNEVSVEEAAKLRIAGLQPGHQDWEKWGIFEHVTKPRLEAAFSGKTHDGVPIEGSYLSGRLISEGFSENLEFFNLTYEDPDLISLGRKFEAISPLLWLRAGAIGPRIDSSDGGWTISSFGNYAVLFDESLWREFVEVTSKMESLRHVFVVTDSKSVFQQIESELPSHVEARQLYEDYLKTFRINTEDGR